MENIITTENISKQYGSFYAVSDISLNVGKGEIYGFLGLNGAGKTTTIRLLLGMIRPTSGSAYIKGKKVGPDSIQLWKDVGHMVEIPYSYPGLSVYENLEIVRRLRLLPEKRVVDQIVERLDLGQYLHVKAKNLSLGNAQRLGLAKALIHHPEILILDEPANGLDPAGIYEIREMLKDLAANHGVTIFISSHILDEVSRFATRIGIIHQGKMIQEVDAQQLDALFLKSLWVGTRDLYSAKNVLEKGGYEMCEMRESRIEVRDPKAIQMPEEVAELLVKAGHPPRLLRVEEEDLEAYFLRTVKEKGGKS